jgi:hypothetical protein
VILSMEILSCLILSTDRLTSACPFDRETRGFLDFFQGLYTGLHASSRAVFGRPILSR